jgi:uridylate kinase
MAGTVVNALVLQDRLESCQVPARVYSALPVRDAAPPFEMARCREDLDAGILLLLAGGTGQPLFTTDTAAALRAVELGA